MREVKALFRPQRLEQVIQALRDIPGLPGVSVSEVHAYAGDRSSADHATAGNELEADFTKLETLVPTALVERVVAAIAQASHTGRAGDGIVFVVPVESFVRIRDARNTRGAI